MLFADSRLSFFISSCIPWKCSECFCLLFLLVVLNEPKHLYSTVECILYTLLLMSDYIVTLVFAWRKMTVKYLLSYKIKIRFNKQHERMQNLLITFHSNLKCNLANSIIVNDGPSGHTYKQQLARLYSVHNVHHTAHSLVVIWWAIHPTGRAPTNTPTHGQFSRDGWNNIVF